MCADPARPQIEAALIAGQSARGVAAAHGLSKSAVARHEAEHLPAAAVKAQQVAEMARADELVQQLRGLQSKTVGALLNAEQKGDARTLLLAVKEARENLVLLWRLTRELEDDRLASIERQLEEVTARFRPMLRIAR